MTQDTRVCYRITVDGITAWIGADDLPNRDVHTVWAEYCRTRLTADVTLWCGDVREAIRIGLQPRRMALCNCNRKPPR